MGHFFSVGLYCPTAIYFTSVQVMCSSLEAVPGLEILRLLLQPFVHLFYRGLLLLVLLFFFFFFFRLVFNIASLSTWFQVSVSKQNCTDGFSLSLIFPWPLLNTYNGLPYLDSFLWLDTVAETKCNKDMSFFHSDSKTELNLHCHYCIKFQLFKDAQDVFSRLTTVCCMLLAHNPYRAPQHYERHICGASCSCKHQFLWISLIF